MCVDVKGRRACKRGRTYTIESIKVMELHNCATATAPARELKA